MNLRFSLSFRFAAAAILAAAVSITPLSAFQDKTAGTESANEETGHPVTRSADKDFVSAFQLVRRLDRETVDGLSTYL